MSDNKNSGVHLLNFSKEDSNEKKFTIIVSGLGRSGTTMIAKMLTAGNVFMGVNKTSVIHEDMALANLIENHKQEQLIKFINNRDANHSIWGFKRPLITYKADFYENFIRNPRYIIVYRDPLAVSMRNMKSIGLSLSAAMDTYFAQAETIRNFVKKNRKPILLMSYEKILLDKEYAAQSLANFCGIDKSKIGAMTGNIIPNETMYLQQTSA